MQKGFGLIGILIVVGIIAILGVGVLKTDYFTRNPFVSTSGEKSAIDRAEDMKDVMEEKSTETTQVSGTTEDETANWRTYKNTRFGVEFKYPSEFLLEEETSHNANSANWPLSNDHLYVRFENNSHSFIFEVNPSPKGFESFQKYGSKKLVISGKTVEVLLNQDSQQSGSSSGIDLLAVISGNNTGGNWLVFNLYCNLATCNQEQMRTTFDNILSTFKFTN